MSSFRRVAAVLTAALSAAALLGCFWKPVAPHPVVPITDAEVPQTIAGYTAAGDYVQPLSVRQALQGATILSRSYQGTGASVDFVLVSGASRDSLHDPRYCLTGAGWRLSDMHEETLPGTASRMAVCQAATSGNDPDVTVGYFYVFHGQIVSDPSAIRGALLWSALLGRQSSSAYFFRFVQPLAADTGGRNDDHQRLLNFAAKMYAAVRPRLEDAQEASALRPSLNG